MPVRRIQPEELIPCEKIQSVAFVFPLDTAELEKKLLEETHPEKDYIAYFNEENTIIACMELPEFQMRYDGNFVRMVGLGGVASLPEYRLGGAIRQIILAAFQEMWDSDTVFSLLYPFSHSYYRKFGYELCEIAKGYEIPMEALASFSAATKGTACKVRMVQPGEDLAGLKAVYSAHFHRYTMAIDREDAHWRKLLGKDSYKERVYTYLLEDETGPCAYVVLTPQDGGANEKKIAMVRELAFSQPRHLHQVLGFLYRLSAQYGKVRMPLPGDIPLSALLEESYELSTNSWEQQMARVIHVDKALEGKRHPQGCTYTLQVMDDILPENQGIYRVSSENATVQVEKITASITPDCTLDVRTLTQLLLGFLSMDEALYKPDVTVHANLDTLRTVFLHQPGFLTEHF